MSAGPARSPAPIHVRSIPGSVSWGLIPAGAGTIRFGGRDITRLPPHERARLGLTTVVQGHAAPAV